MLHNFWHDLYDSRITKLFMTKQQVDEVYKGIKVIYIAWSFLSAITLYACWIIILKNGAASQCTMYMYIHVAELFNMTVIG